MSQRVGRIQQENAKLREQIKKLKGALKDVSHNSNEELPLKASKEKSPISKDRKKELRDEIDNRLNYMMPNKDLVKLRPRDTKIDCVESSKLKESNEIEKNKLEIRDEDKEKLVSIEKGKKRELEESEELLEASFGHEDDKLFEMSKQALKEGKFGSFKTAEQNSRIEENFSPRSIGSLEDDYLKGSLERSEDSPEFSVRSPDTIKFVEPKGLKDSFSSFYNDESLNKTIQEKSFNESLIKPQLINQTHHIENPSTVKKNPQNKDPEILLKNSSSLRSIPSSQSYPEKTLLNEIEALRQENMKLRLQLNKNSKSSLVSTGTLTRFRSRNNVESRKKSKSVSKTKSKSRKCKSRSITPRDLSTRRLKRNVSNNTLVGDSSLTPRRYRHCKTCDHLLSKGYSTKYCGKHGNAKLP